MTCMHFYNIYIFNVFINLSLVALGLQCCMGFSLVSASVGHSLVAVCKPLIATGSLVAAHGLQGTRASAAVVRGLSGCGSWALEHRLDS